MVDLFQQAYITKSRRKLIEDQERFSNEVALHTSRPHICKFYEIIHEILGTAHPIGRRGYSPVHPTLRHI